MAYDPSQDQIIRKCPEIICEDCAGRTIPERTLGTGGDYAFDCGQEGKYNAGEYFAGSYFGKFIQS